MASSQNAETNHSQSPDPTAHVASTDGASGDENGWVDETDDDDMDFEPATEESEDAEYFDTVDDDEADFHGIWHPVTFHTRRLPIDFCIKCAH